LLQLCEISDVGCKRSWMQMAHTLKRFLHDCQSPETTELRNTKCNDVCYVIR
jgi:hypothetical protein